SAHLALTKEDLLNALRTATPEQLHELRVGIAGSEAGWRLWMTGVTPAHHLPKSQWEDWEHHSQTARGHFGGSPQSWTDLMSEIAGDLAHCEYAPTKRTRTVCLTMAYNILLCQPYLYIRDFEGVPEHLKGDKEALRLEVLRIQNDKDYMAMWNEWIMYQSTNGNLPFDI
ncbi:MAG: hypothetical protein EBU08_18900, partial [Micrococcales bacterium]|nr:hypothetical protein [Micrococcales bacterium]